MSTKIQVNSISTVPPDKQDVTFNQLLGINDEGTIAGYFGSGAQNHPNKGYTFTPPYNQNDFHNENFGGSVQTQVTGINNEGVTVGFWANANNANMVNDNFGFVDNNGVISPVDDPKGVGKAPGGMTIEQLLGVNDKDVAVGFWTDKSGNSHGFTYNINSKSFSEVDMTGFASTETTAINNAGDLTGFVVGASGNDVSFIKEGSTVDWLTGPKGAFSVQALGINNEDQVVGFYTKALNGPTFGFLYDANSNTYATINATAAGSSNTVLNGINDKGQIVGFYQDVNGNTDGLAVTFSVKHS